MGTELFEHGFRIVCFLTFVAVVVRESYKKLFPYIHDLYEKYKKFVMDKIKVRERVIKQKEALLREIEEQHKVGERLSEKVMIWAQKEQYRKDRKLQEENYSKKMLKDYMMEQSKFLAVTTARKELMPEIVTQVTDTIYTVYNCVDEQKKYARKIIQALGNESHE